MPDGFTYGRLASHPARQARATVLQGAETGSGFVGVFFRNTAAHGVTAGGTWSQQKVPAFRGEAVVIHGRFQETSSPLATRLRQKFQASGFP
jgi:hypothetical protein